MVREHSASPEALVGARSPQEAKAGGRISAAGKVGCKAPLGLFERNVGVFIDES
jgi:hypothetical protein